MIPRLIGEEGGAVVDGGAMVLCVALIELSGTISPSGRT